MKEDIATLIQMLYFIRDFLIWLVTQTHLIDEEIRSQFEKPLEDMTVRIVRAIERLDTVKSKEDETYVQLDQAGLTGASLRMKAAMGRRVWTRATGSMAESEGGVQIFGFTLKQPMKWINTILGSLAKVFPLLEAVQEYKDHLELAVDERKQEPNWGYKPIFNL